MNETFNRVNVILIGSLIVALDNDKKKSSVGEGKEQYAESEATCSIQPSERDHQSHCCITCNTVDAWHLL
jgi:hypothetical protein